jgi:4-hydroxythreonine-4-phosphate dehydrogenase
VSVLPHIGISIGDPGGIGPEVTLKALASPKIISKAKYVLFASRRLVEDELESLGLRLEVPDFSQSSAGSGPGIFLWEIPDRGQVFPRGSSRKEGGSFSFRCFDTGLQQAREGHLQALVTAPISKQSWSLAGIQWPGHTGYIHSFYPEALMFFWSEKMKVALYSHHLPLRKALEGVERKSLLRYFLRLEDSLVKSREGSYHFLVAGLNPHAGENGMMGEEEQEEISPAVEDAQKKGMDISGPFPPDVIFRRALDDPRAVVIAMYHDQGLIPFKLESFAEGANVTLGIPFIRTSPDHGTAFDIAGRGEADPRSMMAALELARKLSPSL